MRAIGLTYGLDDRPPLPVLLLSGVQHVALIMVVGMVYPILVADRAGVDAGTRETLMGVTLLALAAGTLLQCGRWGPVGSGFLLPANATAAYLAASLKAAEHGGLPLVFGMTVFAGLCIVVFSRVIHRLRPYLPAEIAGLAVTVIGLTVGTLGFRLVFAGHADLSHASGPLPPAALGILVLTTTIAFTIWGSSTLRMFAVLIGFVAGCVLAGLLGMVTLPPWMWQFSAGLRLPIPVRHLPAFDLALVPDFLVAAVACSLRAMGDITTCQKINDPGWKRLDMHSVRRGLLADGLTTILAGLLGTVGTNTSSNSIGIAVATGVTARRVGLAVAAVLLFLAIVPRPRAFIAGMPLEVAGGVLLFSACFIVVNGIRIVMSRMLDARKTIVVGLALVLGLSHDLFPELYAGLPPALAGILGSTLVVSLVSAILLNLLFRLGMTRRVELRLSSRSDPAEPYALLEQRGGEWGARREVVARVVGALVEFREHADELMAPGAEAVARVSYDELAIDVELRYPGRAPDLSGGTDLPPESLLELEPDALTRRLQLVILARLADRATAEQQGRDAVLRLHFEH